MPLADMLQQAPQQAQTPAQQPQGSLAGMMQQGQPQGQQGWSGIVDVQGRKIEVKNGVADIQGNKYYVSNDGTIAADENGGLVGIIQDGKFIKATQEIADELRKSGLLN